MQIWQIFHEWRDPEWYEYPEWHCDLEGTFSTEELAKEFVNRKRAGLVEGARQAYTGQEMRQRSYTITSCQVLDALPEEEK